MSTVVVTMKLGNNAQGVTGFFRISFELYKANSASNIEPGTFGSDG